MRRLVTPVRPNCLDVARGARRGSAAGRKRSSGAPIASLAAQPNICSAARLNSTIVLRIVHRDDGVHRRVDDRRQARLGSARRCARSASSASRAPPQRCRRRRAACRRPAPPPSSQGARSPQHEGADVQGDERDRRGRAHRERDRAGASAPRVVAKRRSGIRLTQVKCRRVRALRIVGCMCLSRLRAGHRSGAHPQVRRERPALHVVSDRGPLRRGLRRGRAAGSGSASATSAASASRSRSTSTCRSATRSATTAPATR